MVIMLARLMPNITGPRNCKRRNLLSVANSIMLYGAEVWADALRHKCHKKKLVALQRKRALRVTCAYRSAERKRVYEAKKTRNDKAIATQERQQALLKWEER
ncbi:uncharacterized protein LOC117181285 [Belonocnema kinseyi]|uniref:uncharacterized protein LOC117181285 n=1 Tax=Belonocnema kinseyi TaxID=2817044 RepID=UPI00143D950E|nr:uncharacterized protein LOC117181285 [Belonocnema kinseyi]